MKKPISKKTRLRRDNLPPEFMQRLKDDWKDPRLRHELLDDFESYCAYRIAEENDQLKSYMGKFELKDILRWLEDNHPSNKLVKEFAVRIANKDNARMSLIKNTGRKGAFKTLVDKLVSENMTEFESVLFELEKRIEYAESSIDCSEMITDVNRVKQQITYIENDKEKTIKFKSLQNIISTLKKSKKTNS